MSGFDFYDVTGGMSPVEIGDAIKTARSFGDSAFSFTSATDKIFHIMAGVDSLTDGAGPNGGRDGDSYFNYVSAAMRQHLGDAGVGWTAFDNRTASREGMSFYRTATLDYIRDLDKTSDPAIYSFDFGGLHKEVAVSGDTGTIGWNASLYDRNWDTAEVYFLQQPGGADISFYQNGTGYVDNIINTDGDLSLQSVVINKNVALLNEIKFRVTGSGKCTVFGVFWRRNVSSGVICSRAAYGGYRTEWFAGLDSTFQQAWLSALAPTHYIFNGGRNDVTVSTPAEFIGYVDNYLSNFPTTTKKLIAAPGEASTDITSSSDMFEYKRRLKQYAAENYHTYIDNEYVLGRYDDAVARGLMLDAVHPNDKGNEIISSSILAVCGISAGYAAGSEYSIDRTRYKFVGSVGVVGLAPGGSSVLMTLSTTQATSAIITVRLSFKNSASTAMRMDRRTFRVLTTNEAVVSVGAVQTGVEHDDVFTGSTLTITPSIVSGNLVITLNSDAGNTGTTTIGATIEYNIVGNDGSLGDAMIIV